jgi:hypothetical protein
MCVSATRFLPLPESWLQIRPRGVSGRADHGSLMAKLLCTNSLVTEADIQVVDEFLAPRYGVLNALTSRRSS